MACKPHNPVILTSAHTIVQINRCLECTLNTHALSDMSTCGLCVSDFKKYAVIYVYLAAPTLDCLVPAVRQQLVLLECLDEWPLPDAASRPWMGAQCSLGQLVMLQATPGLETPIFVSRHCLASQTPSIRGYTRALTVCLSLRLAKPQSSTNPLQGHACVWCSAMPSGLYAS